MLSGKCCNCVAVMPEGPSALCFSRLIMFSSSAGAMGGNVLSSLVMSADGCGISIRLLSDK